jgi:uncharacterized protein (TIGR03437 family)
MSISTRYRCIVLALSLGSLAAVAQTIPDRYTLILQDPPVASRFASRESMADAPAVAYRQQIESRQAAVRAQIEARGMRVTSSMSLLVNALFVSAHGHTMDELRAIPGVVSVTPMRRFKTKLNRALSLLNAPTAWTAVGGASNAGKGIKIGILDTGLEFTNPAFQDSSLSVPAGFPKCTSGQPTDCAFTNSKVIVARSYAELLAGATGPNPAEYSSPDDVSPRDRFGHGTAIAMAAAGEAITAPAIDTTGAPITIRGMAPKAYIGVYKIAGTFGYSTDETMIQAVGDAVADGMDVISTSLGAVAYAASDPVSIAYEAAAKAGPVVVVSAGDDGSAAYQYPAFDSIGSPSNAPDVISVGATTNSHVMTPSLSVVGSGAPSSLKSIPADGGDSFPYYPSMLGANQAPLIDVSTLGNDGLACSALPAGSLNNSYALIERGTCYFDTKAANAQAAGAIGFVFYMADSTAIFSPADITEWGPSVMISQAAGQALKSYLASNPGAQVVIDLAGIEEDVSTFSTWLVSAGLTPVTANMVASYSSFGPTPDGRIKPDIVAPGGMDGTLAYYAYNPPDPAIPSPYGMYSIAQTYDPEGEVYSANGFLAADGSSFSAPLVAGAAALVKQANPKLSAAQIRSLLVNYASQTVTTDDFQDPVDVEWIGAGLLNVGASVNAPVTAVVTNLDGSTASTISFGILQAGSLPITKPITLTNVSSGSITLAAAVSCCFFNGSPSGPIAGTTIVLSASSIPLPAGGTATLTATLSGTVPLAGEYSGSITLTASNVSMQIPFMLLVSDKTPYNINAMAFVPANLYQTTAVSFEGAPGEDLGPTPMLQVQDYQGVPVANDSVTFSVSPVGAVTFNSVSGEPACSPTSSTSSVVCKTDVYGYIWLDMVLGSTAGTATVNFSETTSDTADNFYINIQVPPSIKAAGGVVDGAAFQTPIAPGSYATIFGSGLSTSSGFIYSTLCTYGPCVYPVALNDPAGDFQPLSVSFDVPSAGLSLPGYPWFMNSSQVNIQVPWELAGQTSALVKVTLDGDLFGNVVTVPLATYTPAFFLNSGSVADALDSNYHLITTSNPAKRGQYIQLYANGLGPVNNQPASGAAATGATSTTKQTPTITIGGQQVQPVFSGLAPGFQALYQVNVQVPQAVTPNSAVPITISIGGVTSPAATIPVQ